MKIVNLSLVTFVLIVAILQGCKTSADVVIKSSEKELGIEEEEKNEKKSIFQELKAKDDLSTEEVISYYHQLKEDSAEAYNFDNEQEFLKRYGYMLLQAGEVKEAIKIFKLLVSEFPDSANPYDRRGVFERWK